MEIMPFTLDPVANLQEELRRQVYGGDYQEIF